MRPSKITVQAPQLPSLQPSLVPVNPRISRRFDDASFGYRRGRSPKDALRKVWQEIQSGAEWMMAEREDPDLVILDMMMPKRSGFLVLEKLRRTRRVPMRVIMITANEGSRHKAYAEMLGVDDYIRKPFAMDRLMDSVDRLLA